MGLTIDLYSLEKIYLSGLRLIKLRVIIPIIKFALASTF